MKYFAKPLRELPFQQKKLLLIVQLSFLLLLFPVLSSHAASAYAEKTRLTIKLDNVRYSDVFDAIERQSEFYFFYNRDYFNDRRLISVDFKDILINDLLNELFRNEGISYEISDRSILLRIPETRPAEGSKIASQQQRTISGTVANSNGDFLPGVTVVEKGTGRGTITGNDGKFSLVVSGNSAVLVFSFVGMKSQEVPLEGRINISVVMIDETVGLDEVVVIGYGTQKKINLSGAVDVVTSKDIENRPVNNAIDALQGLSPNLNLSIGNEGGELGAKHNLNIRGLGSISGTGGNPYILIDGVEGDFNLINPSDIESISVLKDASASAIYGARAAFGVILVTTKKGSSSGSLINYSNNLSFSDPTILPRTVNSLRWAEYFNLASSNDGDSPIFSDETIEKIKKYQRGELKDWTEPYEVEPLFWKSYQDAWANTDWYKEEYRRWAPKSNHNISISGGDKNTQYFISGATFNQKGLIKWGDDKYVRNNVNAKINTQINSWLRANFQTRYDKSELTGPSYNTDLWYHNISRRWPTNGVYTPDGNLFYEMEQVWLKYGGRSITENNQLNIIPGVEIEPVSGLVLHANYRYRKNSGTSEVHNSKIKVALATGYEAYLEPNNSIEERSGEEIYNSPNVYLDYNRKLGAHEIMILAGYEQEIIRYSSIYGRKDDIITDNVPSMNTATGKEYASGNKGHWASQSYFSRLNYSFQGKYLLELSMRRDGTSKFASGHRFGNFPSGSVAYIVSQERFFEPLSQYINFLKFRASYGSLGNQDVANYLFVETLPISSRLAYILDFDRPNYAGMPGISSPTLTWEKVRTANFGADISFLKNRLTGSFDYFVRTTLDMLGPAESLPALLGTAVPQSNNATLKTKGFELSLKWRDQIQQFQYSAEFMLADNVSRVLDYYNPQGILSAPFYKGKYLGEIWGYKSAGLFQSDQEAQEVDQSYLSREPWRAGDVHYTDLNTDDKIDIGKNTVADHGDLMIIGNSTPRYSYSLLLNGSWKGIDFNMLWQGIGKRDLWLSGQQFWGAAGGLWNATAFEEHMDYWSPENPGGYFPTPYLGKGFKNQQVQTRYLQNGAYLRLKSISIGYTLPATLVQKAFIKNLRIFVAGENLLTFTRLMKNFDPEGTFGYYGSGKSYPIQMTITSGVNVTF